MLDKIRIYELAIASVIDNENIGVFEKIEIIEPLVMELNYQKIVKGEKPADEVSQ